MKKKMSGKETDKKSFSYRFDTSMDYLQIAMQTTLMVPSILFGAFLVGKLGDIIEISENNSCTIAEAAAIWSSSQHF